MMKTAILLVSLLLLQSAQAATPILDSGVSGMSSSDSIRSSLEKLADLFYDEEID